MAFASSSCKDLPDRISPGSPQDFLFRICTQSCKDLSERNLAGTPQESQELVFARIYKQNAADTQLENPAVHRNVTRSILRENLGKCSAPEVSPTFSACAVEMHMGTLVPRFVRAWAVEMDMEQFHSRSFAAPQNLAPFVRACAVEVHRGMSQKHFLCDNFQGKCHALEASKIRAADFARSCAVENAHGHHRRAILCKMLQEKLPEAKWRKPNGAP